jgi:hypothetical protein
VERQKKDAATGGRSNLRNTSSPDAAHAITSDTKGFIVRLPKEFERSFSDYFDKRYTIIFLCTLIVHFASVMVYLANPPKDEFSARDIQRIQEKFASLVLDKEPIKAEEPTVEAQTAGQQGVEREKREGGDGENDDENKGSKRKRGDSEETSTASAEERSTSRGSAAESRRRSRDQISSEVASKGLLGVLTAGGGSGQGDAVVDVLGDGSVLNSDIGSVLNQIGGIKTTGAPIGGDGAAGGSGSGGKGVRGGRTSGGGGIDDLIGDLGSASSTDIKRRGNLMVAEESLLEEGPGGTKASGRDRDQIMEVVNAHNSAIQSCYQRALKRNPELKGKIVVRFIIAPSGKVTTVEIVSSTLNEPSVESCIVSRISHWDDFSPIDASKGDAAVRQVYTFGY